ncbi:MAG TPA: PLP-dependent aminotransferase family protein [Caulobacteraceae bacterium]|jgi:GntR family transcriptional regulator/MocR family aminotransferase|nr:PLP-dependent aminotransferase family protein [Caulobacteraceae bacterium]
MTMALNLKLDRSVKRSLAEQIYLGVSNAINDGVLSPGARLPSWQDLATQLGVARGTVRTAYEKLTAAQLIEASRAAGTRVARRPRVQAGLGEAVDAGPFIATYEEMIRGPAHFQMGVPAIETYPATLLSRLRARAVRAEAAAPPLYPDPRGELELRREIAGYLAVARGLACSPSQVIITGGFGAGLGLTLHVLGLAGCKAWMEDPGFPWSRKALELGGLSLAHIPVDGDGIDVDGGLRLHADAKLVLVTPGQQAPLGGALSLDRRLRLLEWAAAENSWIVEDDYLSELQLSGRAAPALASLDRAGRVIHIGSFSKTISPSLRLGFLVAPVELVPRFAEAAACLGPPPGPSIQNAIAEFMREGHYMRHLRRTKRAYAAKRQAVLERLRALVPPDQLAAPALAVLLKLPAGACDLRVARELSVFGISPTPLSPWYASSARAESALLLGVATAPTKELDRTCERLVQAINRSA